VSLACALRDAEPTQNHQFGFVAALLTQRVCRFEQPRKFRGRIVCGDPSRPVPEEVLPVFEAHPRGAQASSEGVLEVVYPNLPQVRFFPRPFPGAVQHVGDRFAPEGEDMGFMLPASCFRHRGGKQRETLEDPDACTLGQL
jgi:hypothetical protein